MAIDGPPSRMEDRDLYEVLPRDDPQGTVYLPAGPDVDGALTVEAKLVVIHHPVYVVGAVRTRAFTEYRLLDAEPVNP